MKRDVFELLSWFASGITDLDRVGLAHRPRWREPLEVVTPACRALAAVRAWHGGRPRLRCRPARRSCAPHLGLVHRGVCRSISGSYFSIPPSRGSFDSHHFQYRCLNSLIVCQGLSATSRRQKMYVKPSSDVSVRDFPSSSSTMRAVTFAPTSAVAAASIATRRSMRSPKEVGLRVAVSAARASLAGRTFDPAYRMEQGT